MNDKLATNKVNAERPFQIHEDVGFSSDEKRLLVDYYVHSSFNRWSWYFVYLFPMVVFAGYGMLQHDVIAIAVAFGALLLFVIWSLYGGIKSTEHLRSIFTKYETYIAHIETERTNSLEMYEAHDPGKSVE